MATYQSLNPFTGELLNSYPILSSSQLSSKITLAEKAFKKWKTEELKARNAALIKCSELLLAHKTQLASLVTLEMGKLNSEAIAEIEKSALVCRYYAEHSEVFLKDKLVNTNATKSLIRYQPLGSILAVMPWNFPVWQVFRFLAPNIASGNSALLKPAPNVPQTSMLIESIVNEACATPNLLQVLFTSNEQVKEIISSDLVKGVTLTGSPRAGRSVARLAGEYLKPCVLELGGSDPFIVLEDSDLESTVDQAIAGRFSNAGQTCIAAKRFIVQNSIKDRFIELFSSKITELTYGDPMKDGTSLAPLARKDLQENLHEQVVSSVEEGARCLIGGKPIANTYSGFEATLLEVTDVDNPAFQEELFGPVACVMGFEDEKEAIAIANHSVYGLGASIWSKDIEKAEALANAIETGSTFINTIVKSDPRLPFGGINQSGFGRELAESGIHQFMNIKTVWIQ